MKNEVPTIKEQLDIVEKRMRFWLRLIPWRFKDDTEYRHEMMIEAQGLNISTSEITKFISDEENDFPF